MDTRLNGYFDYASSTPLDDGVYSAMLPYFAEFYNVSALYSANSVAKSAIDKARSSVASFVGVKKTQVVFTSGCTEANNLAIQGVMQSNQTGKVLFSALEHDSVKNTCLQYSNNVIPCTSDGIVDIDALTSMIDDDVVLVCVMYINNEIGTIQPIRKISEQIHSIRAKRGSNGKPLYLHVDAAQAPHLRTITQSALGFDLMSINGGKIYGPKGSGCLIVGQHVELEPHLRGGGQEFGLRSGTENTPAIVGFAEALHIAGEAKHEESIRLVDLKKRLEAGLKVLGGQIICESSERSESITAVLFEGVDAETLVYKLDKLSFSVTSGSACHAKSGVKSTVLRAIGLTDQQAMNVIRISIGKYTTAQSVDELLKSAKLILA